MKSLLKDGLIRCHKKLPGYIHLYRGSKAALAESMQFIRSVSSEMLAHLIPRPHADSADQVD